MPPRHPIDPALRQYLDALDAVSGPLPADDAARVREVREGMVRALSAREAIPGLPNAVRVRDVVIGAGLTGRLYLPERMTPAPAVLVYTHGGGWVFGSVETHDPFCRLLADAAGVIILSVEYRLAPEHPYPAARDDALAAWHWAVAEAAGFGGDPRRVLLGGDSAGAQLAMVTARRVLLAAGGADGRAAVRPAGVMLLYPATDHPSGGHASYVENATGYRLTAEAMHWFWRQYAPDGDPADPDLSPLRAGVLPDMPPVLVATADYDPLRDEGIALARRLETAGVAVTHLHAPDMHHNFPVHPGSVARFSQCDTAMAGIAGWLRSVAA
ncbi:alpha/beta hydrolase [Tistrella mobilis]|uniref:alpha/beta hydrolase n=1 Tax=Tistrella mobilis TaxID=171437 RepID=UPI00355770D1